VSTINNDNNAALYPSDALAADSGLDTINTGDASTLDELFRERVRRSNNKLAYTQFDEASQTWREYSWAQIANEVERWQVAFHDSGLIKGDRVAICYRNSVEWVVFDQAALRLGLVIVPLYTADRADNIAYVIENSGSKLVLFEDSGIWSQVKAADEDTSCVERVIVFKGDSQGVVHRAEDWLPEHGQHYERGVTAPDDLASIVYTSGTTGRPKGVMLSHRNMLSNAYAGMRSVALKPTDTLLSFLPLSHTLERTVGYYASMMSGSEVTYNRSIKQLSDDLEHVKPTVMISVPRIFERVHNKIYEGLMEQSKLKQWLFNTAIKVGWRRFKVQQGLQSWHPSLLLVGVFDALVANKVLAKLGGKLDYVIVGGAPLTQEVAKTFISLGLPLLQGYGLTESSPIVSVNTKERNRPDSIGLLLRGVNVKIMENDELWVQGDNVMLGYWQNEEATSKTIVVDGDQRWLRTGDRAAISADGFVRIIGRIKDILVLANGEKVPPPDIEAAVARNPIFEQVMVVGEGKSFLSVLVVCNEKLLSKICAEHNWSNQDLTAAPLQEYLVARIADQMNDFPGYAKIRKVHICPEPWTVEAGLLTPTLKLKRPKVMQHYAVAVDALYAGHGVHKS